MSEPCEPVAVMEDGWSEWIHPVGRFRMQCCDCSLVHDLEFAITVAADVNVPLNYGESANGVIIFRARRAPKGVSPLGGQP